VGVGVHVCVCLYIRMYTCVCSHIANLIYSLAPVYLAVYYWDLVTHEPKKLSIFL